MKKTCILVYLLLVLATYTSLIYHAITLKDAIDFSMFYYVAVHFLQGVSIYAATPWHLFHIPQLINAKETFFQLPIASLGKNYCFNLNPPVLALITFWLGWLPYSVAASLWFWAILAAGALAIALLYREFFSQRNLWGYLIFLETFFATLPMHANLMLSETGTFVMLGVVGVWMLARSGKDFQAGFLLGFILSIKYFLGLIFILFLLQKRWRIIFSATVVFLGLNAIALFWLGKEAFIQYHEIVQRVVWFANDWNAGLFGFFARFASSVHQGVFTVAAWVKPLTLFCSAGLVFYQIKLCRKPFATKQEFDFVFSYVLIITMLISPLAWVYYLVLMVLPLLCILRTLTQLESAALGKLIFVYAGMLALLSYPNTFHVISMAGMGGFALEHSAYFYGLCLLLGLLCYGQKKWPKTVESINVQAISPWVYLTYALTAPAFYVLFYGVFIRVPRIWQ